MKSIKHLSNKINCFFKLAEKEELPENSDDLETVLKNLSELETFTARVDYAEKNLKHLSSGSSRVVYLVDDGKQAMKLAKNDRGISQNKIESKIKSKFINETTKFDKDGVWKLSPFLDKITEKEFEKLIGVNFKDFGKALDYGLQDVSDDSAAKPKDFNKIKELPIYKELVAVGKKHKLMPGDMSRISSWCMKDDVPMLVDAGLTKEIYDEFY
jgi:hypothetical protein